MYIQSFVALLAATSVSAAPAVKVARADGQWELQQLNTHTPSGRPGNSPYSLLNATIQGTEGDSNSTAHCNLQYLSNDDAPWGVELPCTTDKGSEDTWAFTLERPEGEDGDASTNFDLSFKWTTSAKTYTGGDHFQVGDNLSGQCGGSGVCSWGLKSSPYAVDYTSSEA